jgi:hypothetical protein
MSHPEKERYEAALARMLDGEPEPGDGELLARAMRQDPALLREASGLFAVDELLRQNSELSEADFAGAVAARLAANLDQTFAGRVQNALPSRSKNRWRSGRWIAAAVASTSLLAIGYYCWLAWQPDPALRETPEMPKQEVATLLLAEKCDWQPSTPQQEGRRLTTGPLRLRQGLAVLRFDGGAELILRGDTEIVLQSAVQALLVKGEVSVRAPEEAAGFRLLTPASLIVDLGTEFAAKVEPSGATELHVIEGKVSFSPLTVQGHRAEVLQGGKAVRFDDASVARPREIQMRAANFQEIIRAAHPTARAELMHAYEGFSYRAGRLPFGEGGGGHGWRGPWHAAARNEAYREVEEPVLNLDIVHNAGNVPRPAPGERMPGMKVPIGTTSIARTLERPLALDEDGVFYFSLIVHEPEAVVGVDERQFGGVRLVLRDAAGPLESMLSFGPTRTRRPGIRMGNGPNFTSPLQVARNQSTFWLGKMITRRQGDDEVFFSIYGEMDAIEYAEPATWQVATRGIRRNGRLNVVVIAGQLSAHCTVDELRIGPTWRSVAPLQELAEVR